MNEYEKLSSTYSTIENRKPTTKNISRAKTYERKDGSSEIKSYIQQIVVQNQPKQYEYKNLRKNMRELIRTIDNITLYKVVDAVLNSDEVKSSLVVDTNTNTTTTIDMEEEDAIIEPTSIVVGEAQLVSHNVLESPSDSSDKEEVPVLLPVLLPNKPVENLKKKINRVKKATATADKVKEKKKAFKKPVKMPPKKGEKLITNLASN
jgi:soluble cytochrome b562